MFPFDHSVHINALNRYNKIIVQSKFQITFLLVKSVTLSSGVFACKIQTSTFTLGQLYLTKL